MVEDLLDGQKGLANFTNKYFLCGKNNPVYLCTDKAIQKFIYIDENKETEDVNAQIIIKLIINGLYIIKDIYDSCQSFLEEIKNNSNIVKTQTQTKLKTITDSYIQILSIFKNSDEFKNQLSKILPSSINTRSLNDEHLNIISNNHDINIDKLENVNKEKEIKSSLDKQIIIKEVQPLVINDYSLVYRKEDGYVDVTNLCKAGGKKFNHWNSLEKTQAFIKVLSNEAGIPVSKLIEVISGGNFKNQGTWAHPQVAINIAQWISPEFDVKVSKWVFELMITGKVELGKEKTNKDLDSVYKEQIKTLTNQLEITTNQLEITTNQLKTNKQEYQSLFTKHNSSLKNHRYIKFKKSDPCFYIIDSGIKCDCNNHYKFGIAGTDEKNTIDERLQSHRTLWPLLKVHFLLFIKDVLVIEKNFKMMYEKEINPNGHEIVEGVSLEDMINRLKKLFDLLNIKDYYIMSDEKLKEYNDYVNTTVKYK